MLQVNSQGINKKKIIGYILIPVALFLGFISIGAFSDGEVALGIVFGVITLGITGYSYGVIHMANVYLLYSNLINNGFLTIEELQTRVGKNKEEILEDIQNLIQNNIFLNIYLDLENKKIEFMENISNSTDHLEKYKKTSLEKIVKCPNCGATIQKKVHGKMICEYCETEIH